MHQTRLAGYPPVGVYLALGIPMKLRPFQIILLYSIMSVANAGEPFFHRCDRALGTLPFQPLREFYLTHKEEARPESCFRLNKKEFLVTVMDTGRLSQGLYYLNTNTGSYEFPDGTYRAGISVDREFEGPNKKRFAILRTSDLHLGNWSVMYELIYLIPQTKGYPFQIQDLLYVNEDPVSGMCGDTIKKGNTTSVKHLRVEKEGTPATALVFLINNQACPNGKEESYERRFTWSKGMFRETR